MTLQPGTRLGHYEITSLLGSGGMGEVYRAKDHKLGRDVAIKVLREDLANDPVLVGGELCTDSAFDVSYCV